MSYFQIIQDEDVICEGFTAEEAKDGAIVYFQNISDMESDGDQYRNHFDLIVREVSDTLGGYEECGTPWTLTVSGNSRYERAHENYLRSPYLTGRA